MNVHNTRVIIIAGFIALSHSFAQNIPGIAEIERFALATNRTAVLAETVPGSDSHYYYSALHALNEKRFSDFQDIFNHWKNDRNDAVSSDMEMLENRFSILLYEQAPKEAVDALRYRIGWHPSHTRRTADTRDSTPSTLNNARLDAEHLLNQHLSQSPSSLSFLTDEGLFLAAKSPNLSARQRRDLLSRLTRPDCPNLIALIAADLNEQDSRGFGSLPIHPLLTLSQLQELAHLRPELKEDPTVIEAVIARLAPPDSVNLETNPNEKQALLDRLWMTVATLPASHNGLKTLVLYNCLLFDESQNIYDRDRFMTYLKLPRQVPHLQPRFRDEANRKHGLTPLGVTFKTVPLPPVPNDEPLVRRFLLAFLKDDPDTTAFSPYLSDDFLKPLFAEAKFVNGIGTPTDWANLISPDTYRQIKTRVDLDLLPTNPTIFDPDSPVSLNVCVKNVDALTINIYEVNTFNYYRLEQAPLNLAMNLDGLVATETLAFSYDTPAERRIERSFPLPMLNRRGAWVVEFIGNGKSSRALIQKGRLEVVEKITAAGHTFTIFDEHGQPIPDATAWLDGRAFSPNKNGVLFVPFTTEPGDATLIVQADNFATRFPFHHQAEAYTLTTGFHVDREALLSGNQADVLIRPSLTVHEQPASINLLEKPKLIVRTTDIRGLPTERVFTDLVFDDNKETVVSLAIPENLTDITFTLTASIDNLAFGRKDTLASNHRFPLNAFASTQKTYGVFFGQDADGYYAECRGLNGERLSERRFLFTFEHRLFVSPLHQPLKTDEHGRVRLGALENIGTVTIRFSDRSEINWELPSDRLHQLPQLHGITDATLRIPITWTAPQHGSLLTGVSLLEQRGNTFVKDWTSETVSLDGHTLVISRLPAGDFSLALPSQSAAIPVRIITPLPSSKSQFAFSENRMLERAATPIINIQSITEEKDAIKITLNNANAATRVHLYASRYSANFYYNVFDNLAPKRPPIQLQHASCAPAIARYESGRTLGDEARYILDRQQTQKFPGNMLERPGLLLNPWERRDTSADTEKLAKGGAYRSASMADNERLLDMEAKIVSRKYKDVLRETYSAANLVLSFDFLAQPGIALLNLKPDAQGKITIPRESLRNLPMIRVVAMDDTTTIMRTTVLPAPPTETRERRLANGLDPEKPSAMTKHVTGLPAGKTATIADFTTARFILCDTVEKAFGIFSALKPDPTLETFSFITRWPTLGQDEQNRLYSKYACHELNVFLYHKDRAFFDTVIAPNLANKRDKTFIDDYLLSYDLTGYLDVSRYAQLNTAERALLARRLSAEQAPSVKRDIADSAACIIPSPEAFNRRFDTALRLGALETEKSTAQSEMDGLASDRVERLRKNKFDTVATTRSPVVMRGIADARAEPASAPAEAVAYGEDLEIGGALLDAESIRDAREATRIFFRQATPTKEWAENNYWHQTPDAQNADLVPMNRFWDAVAAHDVKAPFLPESLIEADSNFTEIMLALAVTDLPFEAVAHEEKVNMPAYTLTAGSNLLLFHREIRPAERAPVDAPPVLVVQRFFRSDDRYRRVDGEQVEKEITDEFIAGIVYGARVVLANSTPQRQKINTIIQIPEGALPVGGSSTTRDEYLVLEPYTTDTRETFFYFPEAGTFNQFPAAAADLQGRHLAGAEAMTFTVVDRPTSEDRASWAWISQNGSLKDVLNYLETHNLRDLQSRLDDIGWRMQEADSFTRILDSLRSRHIYHEQLWSYALLHHDEQAIREFLHNAPFSRNVGLWLRSTLLNVDPVEQKRYEHLEYAPLINPRAHQLGAEPTILNEALRSQYHSFLDVLSFKPTLDPEDQLAAAYYLLLQDRIPEALAWFDRVDRSAIAEKLQVDYMHAIVALYRADVDTAAAIAERYRETGVDKWRDRFAQLNGVIKTIRNPKRPSAADADPENRDATLGSLAATEANLELTVEAGTIQLASQNVKAITINIYPMDIEPLFSHNPFLREASDRFAVIRPAFTTTVTPEPDQATTSFDIPDPYRSENIMVEAIAGGIRRSAPSTATTLDVRIIENYGQLIVHDAKTGAPVPGAYIKVYAKTAGVDPYTRRPSDSARFYKDGYTDLRGRFDYYSLNPGPAAHTPSRLAILIMSPGRGAIVKEADPPRE